MTTEKIKQYTKETPKDINGKIEILLKHRQELALICEEAVNTNEIRNLIGQIKIINVKIKHLLGI